MLVTSHLWDCMNPSPESDSPYEEMGDVEKISHLLDGRYPSLKPGCNHEKKTGDVEASEPGSPYEEIDGSCLVTLIEPMAL